MCTFQPGNFTGWGSEGVKDHFCFISAVEIPSVNVRWSAVLPWVVVVVVVVVVVGWGALRMHACARTHIPKLTYILDFDSFIGRWILLICSCNYSSIISTIHSYVARLCHFCLSGFAWQECWSTILSGLFSSQHWSAAWLCSESWAVGQ